MSKLIIFSFDGTSNDPSDAEQKVDYKGTKEDDNITNILKFHLMAGGDLLPKNKVSDYESNWSDSSQLVFYYQGIGTYGSRLKRLFNAALSSEKLDVASILRQAMQDFKDSYQIDDKVLVTGFSRGAALARRFVALIERHHQDKAKRDPAYANLGRFVYEAIYETVASIGVPNLDKSKRPESDVVFENGHSLPGNVVKALHCLSLDDKRLAFRPTLMNDEEGIVHEVWFAGAHSDVGGGFYRDRLSDVSLEYLLQWVSDNVPNVKYAMPTEEMLEKVIPEWVKYEIGLDDLARNPSPFGKNHQQDRFFVLDWTTLADRLCCVIEHDRPSTKKPLIHWSVATRINGDGDYRPKSLKNKKHTVVYADARLKECNGLTQHIETPRSDLRYLAKPCDSSAIQVESVTAFANQLYNHSGLMLEKGGTYRFSVQPDQKWKDGKVDLCGPEGWNRDSEQLGFSEVGIAMMEPFRRVPDADWFCLCGCITDDDYSFEIGKGPVEIQVQRSGEFMPFANDHKRFYGNNEGKITITVERLK